MTMLAQFSKRLGDRLAGLWQSREDALLTAMSDPRVYHMMRWRRFLEQAFVPRVFFDIGANDPFSREGQQTVFKPLMPDTRFYLFEAMVKHEPALKRSGEPYALAVLDAADGVEKTFYETRSYAPGTGDSVYLEKTSAYAASAVVETKHLTRRLDRLVADRDWPLPDFLKLDTQGSELDILKGADRCLAHARGVQVECNLQMYNDGAPLLHDVVAFLQTAGFNLFDISQFHYGPKKDLIQIDAMFIRADVRRDLY